MISYFYCLNKIDRSLLGGLAELERPAREISLLARLNDDENEMKWGKRKDTDVPHICMTMDCSYVLADSTSSLFAIH